MGTTFKPSQVNLWRAYLPLVGTLGRAELEMAAALLVLTCRHRGDAWGPVEPRQIGETLKRELEDGCMKHLRENLFMPMPDFRGLVAGGFAESTLERGAPLALTEKGLEALGKNLLPVNP